MLLDFLPLAILVLHFCDKYLLSQGKLFPVYLLTIAGSISTVAYNLLLWSELNRNHKTILLFAINSSWTIAMAVKGIIRLSKEAKTKRLPSVPMSADVCPAKVERDKT